MNDTNTTENNNDSLAYGLHALMQPGKGRFWKHLDDCHEFMIRRSSHPFRLPLLPCEVGYGPHDIIFAGATYGQANDLSVPVFLANIRYWVGLQGGHEITGLRIISMPYSRSTEGKKHWVFFEFQMRNRSIISGETNDFTGSGITSQKQLESVFEVLSLIYGVNIERVDVREVDIKELYREEP